MKVINANEIDFNFIKGFGEDWALVVVDDGLEDNAMTISWGGIGVIWAKPVATCYIKNVRYTKHMMDKCEYFSISFFDNSYHKNLQYLGSASRADEDKITKANLTREYVDGVLILKEAKLTLVLKKIYQIDLKTDNINDEIKSRYYKNDECHTQYIGEIIKVIVN